jgi:hypothetical protein
VWQAVPGREGVYNVRVALAEQGTNLSVARLIWAYEVEAEVDEKGVEIPVYIFMSDYQLYQTSCYNCRKVGLFVVSHFNYTQVLSFFSLAKGKTGKLTKSRSGSNWRPEPFKVCFTPRNEEIKRTIIREGEQALKDLRKYERETKYTFSTFYQ